jgi:lycopene cyclase domain-containing protein
VNIDNNSLYLAVDLLSLSVPLLVSFHPRLKLHHRWMALFAAIFLSMIPYVIWDVYFTVNGYWGFNPEYLTGIYLFHLPIEEWLFFVCIPYACVFTHLALLELNPRLQLTARATHRISYTLFAIFALVLILNWNRAYTAVDMIFGILILSLALWKRPELLRSFYLTFLVMLIPFFIVNGILTGTGIEGNIVWYNDQENLGIRLGTIPVEDSVYAFSMILLNLLLFTELSEKWHGQKKEA